MLASALAGADRAIHYRRYGGRSIMGGCPPPGRSRRRGRSSSTPAAATARSGSPGTTRPDLVVLSLWRDNVCAGSFRLAVDEVPDLIDAAARRASTAAYRHAPHPPAAAPG